MAELRSGQALELSSTVLDVETGAPCHVDELPTELDVLVVPVVAVARELPVAEDELDFLGGTVVAASHLSKIGESHPAALTTTTLPRLHAQSSMGCERLSGVVEPGDVDSTAQLALVNHAGVLQGLATTGLDLPSRLVDILFFCADVAERLVADVEHVGGAVERAQCDALELAVVDADEPTVVAGDERTLHDPHAVRYDEGGLFDHLISASVCTGLQAGLNVRVEHPLLLRERHSLGVVGHLNHLLCDTIGIFVKRIATPRTRHLMRRRQELSSSSLRPIKRLC